MQDLWTVLAELKYSQNTVCKRLLGMQAFHRLSAKALCKGQFEWFNPMCDLPNERHFSRRFLADAISSIARQYSCDYKCY